MMSKVYVVMGNDYPDCVFDNIESAQRYVDQKKAEKPPYHPAPKIYWRLYEFEVLK